MITHELHFELISEPNTPEYPKDRSIVQEISLNLFLKNIKTNEVEEINSYISIGSLIFPHLYYLSKSQHEYSSSGCFILNCACGISECAGIYNGIKLKLNNNTIAWNIPKDPGYKSLKYRKYVFSVDDYNQKIQSIINLLISLEKEKPKTYTVNGSFIKGFFRRTLFSYAHAINNEFFKPLLFPEFEKYLNRSFKGLSKRSIVYKVENEFITPFIEQKFKQ